MPHRHWFIRRFVIIPVKIVVLLLAIYGGWTLTNQYGFSTRASYPTEFAAGVYELRLGEPLDANLIWPLLTLAQQHPSTEWTLYEFAPGPSEEKVCLLSVCSQTGTPVVGFKLYGLTIRRVRDAAPLKIHSIPPAWSLAALD